MELENNPTPVETLDMPMGSDSYAPLPQQGRRLRNFGRFARRYQSHKTLLIILSVVALLSLSYGTWALVKASRHNPDKLANTSDNAGGAQKTVVVLPGQDQILSINAKLKVNNATTVNGDLAVAKTATIGGDLTAGNISAANIRGTFTGVYLGDGSALTNVNAVTFGGQNSSFYLNASNINAGTLNDNRLSANVTLQGNAFNGANQLVQLNASGGMPAVDGSNLSGVNAALLAGQASGYYTDATNLSSGTLNDARLSTNVALLDASNSFTNTNTFTGNLTVQGTVNGQSAVFSNNVAAMTFTQNGSVVCDNSGNCASSTINGSGTTNKIALFTGAGDIGDSIITQSGALIAVAGTLSAANLQGDGSAITNVNASQLNSQPASFYQDATNLTAGTVSPSRLPATVVYSDGANTFTGTDNFTGGLQRNGNTVCDSSNNCGYTTGGAFATAFVQTGNSFGGTAFLGTNDNFALVLQTNGSERLRVNAAGGVTVTGTLSATNFSGNGAGVTNVDAAALNGQAGSYYQNASNISAGTLADGRLSANVTLQGNGFNGVNQLVQLNGSGALPALNGALVTNVDAITLQGHDTSYFANATLLTSGTLSDGRLSANVVLLNGNNTFTANNNFTGGLQRNGNTVCDTSGNCTTAGAAGGDLTGTYPNPTIAKLQGVTVGISSLTSGQILQYNGTNWINQTVSGDVSLSGAGAATIANGAITTVKIADANVTNAKLVNSSLTVSPGTGLTGGGVVSLGGSTSLAVSYGSSAGTAVEGNTTLTVNAGTNITGGGSVTLGAGGSVTVNVSDTPTFTNLTLTTPLAISSGGTDANTAGGARTNLGAAASGANNDITSLTGLTTALSVSQGGTGINGGAAGNGTLLIGNGSGYTLSTLSAGSGISVTNTAGSITIASTGSTGTAGGDLTGSYPNPTIAKLQGTTVSIASLAGGNFLQYNGTAWVNQSISGDVTVDNSGVAAIGAGKVTNTNLVNDSLTVSAGSGLGGGGVVALGGSTTLNVQYGSTAGTAVQGNTTITCAGGSGNLTGGGDIITLGTGGSCSNLNIISNPTFTTSVTTPLLQSTSALGLSAGGANIITFSTNGAEAVRIDAAGNVAVGTTTTSSYKFTVAGSANASTLYQNGNQVCDNTNNCNYVVSTSPASYVQNGTTTQTNTNFNIQALTSGVTGTIGGIIRGAIGGQTADLFQAQASSGTVVASIDASGNITAANGNYTGNLGVSGTTTLAGDVSITGSGTFTTNSGAVTLGALGVGVVQSNASGLLSSGAIDRNSATLLANTLNLNNGGTGSTTAGGARTNLGAAASGANGDIASLTAITSIDNAAAALTIGNTNQALTLQGNSSSVFTATAGGFTTSVGFANPTASVSYLFQSASAGTYNICTSVGNCASSGGGVTTAGGTIGTLPYFNGSQTLADSLVSQAGGTVTIGGSLAVNTIVPTAALLLGVTSQNITVQGAAVAISATAGASTNTLSFAAPSGSSHSVTLPNASGTVAVSATGPLAIDSSGNVSCATCLTSGGGGSGGVSSLNTLNGALTLQGTANQIVVNSAGTTITLSTPQDINTSSSPTFSNLTLTGALGVTGTITGGNLATGGTLSVTGAATAASFNGLTLTATAGGFTVAGGTAVKTVTVTSDVTLDQNLSTTSSPTFAGLAVTGTTTINNTGTAATTIGNATGGVTISSLAAGIVQSSPAGLLSTGAVDRNSATLLTGTLNAANGGTGQSTYAIGDLLYASGATALSKLSDVASGSCLISGGVATAPTWGSCGSGGTVTGTGTINTLAMFTAAGAIGDSILTQSGTAITVTGSLTATTALQGNTLSIGTGSFTVNATGAITASTGIATSGGYVQTGAGANTFSGATTFSSAGTGLAVTTNATVGGTLVVTGIVSGGAYNGQTISSTANFTGTLAVAGVTTLSGALNANGGIVTNNANLNAGSGTITSGAINGQTISATANFTGSLGVTGSTNLIGAATFGTASATTGQIKLANGTSAFLATLQSAALTQDTTYTLPASTGPADTFCLLTLANCSGAGASTVGALDGGTANATGATIAANTLYLQSASVSFAGLVNTGVQSFAGAKTFTGNVAISGSNTLTVGTGATSLGGTLGVTGATTLSGTLAVTGVSTFNGNVGISGTNTLTVGTGATVLGGTLGVTGASTLTGLLTANGGITDTGAVSLNGATSITGANNLTVGTGATSLGGTLAVTGATTLSGTLAVTGASTFNGNVGISGTNTLTVGTGATSLGGTLAVTGASTFNGNVSVTGTNTFTTGSGAVTLGALGAGVVQSSAGGLLSSGTVTVANGGTGVGTFTANGILYGNGTGVILATAAVANAILATNGTNIPALTQMLPAAVQGNITATGILGAGSITTTFGTISTTSTITTTAALQGATVTATGALQGNTLSINAGAFAVNSSGAITAATGIATTGNFAQTGSGTFNVQGVATFQNATNSLAAFSVKDSSGSAALSVDTTNRFVGIGNASPSATLDVVASTPAYFNNFESGLLTPFTTSGGATAQWSVTTSASPVPYSGSYVAQVYAPNGTNNVANLILTKTLTGAGNVSFWYQCTSYWSGFTFQIDSGTKNGMAGCGGWGTSGWLYASYGVAAGTHTFTWSFDGVQTGGNPSMSVDNVNITNVGSGTAALFNGGGVGIGLGAGNAPAHSLDVLGDAQFKSSANSTTAFSVQNAAGSSLLTVDSTNSKVVVAALDVTNNATVGGTLAVTSTTNLIGAVTFGTASATTGQIKLANTTSAFLATLQGAALTQSTTYTLPASTGPTDTICLTILNNCVGSGASSVGSLNGGTLNANGATIAASTLYLQTANTSWPGLVSTGIQSFAGAKTFTSVSTPTLTAVGTLTIQPAGATTINSVVGVNGPMGADSHSLGGSGGTAPTTLTVVGGQGGNGEAYGGTGANISIVAGMGGYDGLDGWLGGQGGDGGNLYLSGGAGTVGDSTNGTNGSVVLQSGGGWVSMGGPLNVAGTSTFTSGLVVTTATATQDRILVTAAAVGAARFDGTITNADLTAARTYTLPNESGTICTTAAGGACSALGFYIQNQNVGAQATSNFWMSGTGRADTSVITPVLDTASAVALNIGSTASVINLNKNVTVAAGQSIALVGGITSTRPASPTEGMLYYDTTVKQLLVYTNIAGNLKWQADRSNSTKIVGTSASTGGAVASQSPDSADYVNTSTTSAQTVINAAITALPATGGSIYLMEGTYIVDGSINVPSNVMISGAGTATIIKVKSATNSNLNLILCSGINNIIQNLQIDGNKATQSGAFGMNGIYLNGSFGSKVSNVIASNMYWGSGSISAGIYVNSSINVTITGNTITGNSNSGIDLNTSSLVTITGNVIQSNGVQGIVAASSNINTITGNTITSNGNYGIFIISAGNNTIASNTINSNGTGIFSSGNNNNTITGNTLQSNTSIGVSLGSSNNNTITGNTLQSNGTSGISLSGSNGNTIGSNNVYNNGGATANNGIYLSASDSNTITGNDSTDTSCSTNCYAINVFDATSDTNYLADNRHNGTAANPSTINDAGTGTIYANQTDGSGNLINKSQGGGLTVGASSANSSLTLQGGLKASALPVPVLSATVTNVGTVGATTHRYQITALDGLGETTGSTIQQTTTGNATLSGVNYNTITWTPVGGAYQYRIYRCTGAACTPALLTTVAGNTTSYNDQANGAPSGALPTTNTTGGASFSGNLLVRTNADSTTAFQVQDAAGNSALVMDSTTSTLKVYENVASPTNFASISYAGGSAIFAASSGTTQIGSAAGGGNINLVLTGVADQLLATKTNTLVAAYSVNDFKFTRNLTAGAFAATGNVMTVEDLSTIGAGSSAPNVLYVNQNNTSATGNLILAQTGGSTDRFKVTTAGNATLAGGVTIGAGSSYSGAGAVTLQSGAATALTITANAGSTWSTSAGALTLSSAAALTLTGATASTLSTTSGALTMTSAAATTWSTTTGNLTLLAGGASSVILKPGTDSASAVQFQNAAGSSLLNFDSTSNIISVGVSDTVGTLLVLDTKTGAGDPTGVNGGMYYNSALHQFRCYRDSNWETCGVNPIDRGYVVEDDFLGGTTATDGAIGNAGWSRVQIGTPGNILYNSASIGLLPSSDHPGVLSLQTPSGTNLGTTLTLADTSGLGSVVLSAGQDVKTTVSVGSAATTTQTLRIGLHNETGASAAPTSGVWWEADPTVSANWRYCYVNAGPTVTCAASGTAIAANSWVRLEIRVTALGAGTSALTFVINGTASTVSGVTVNTTNAVNPSMTLYTQNTTPHNAEIDYFQFQGVASAAR